MQPIAGGDGPPRVAHRLLHGQHKEAREGHAPEGEDGHKTGHVGRAPPLGRQQQGEEGADLDDENDGGEDNAGHDTGGAGCSTIKADRS